MKLIKRTLNEAINGERAKVLLEHKNDFGFYLTDAGFNCPLCKDRVLIVNSQFAHLWHSKGAYCGCFNWLGNANRVPASAKKWKQLIKKAFTKTYE